jgi:hypothetical protein
MTSCTNGNCGSKTCGFGKKKKSAFGSGADAFFGPPFTGNANIQKIGECLKNGIYSNATPLSRFGSKSTKKGPMKIGSKGKK